MSYRRFLLLLALLVVAVATNAAPRGGAFVPVAKPSAELTVNLNRYKLEAGTIRAPGGTMAFPCLFHRPAAARVTRLRRVARRFRTAGAVLSGAKFSGFGKRDGVLVRPAVGFCVCLSGGVGGGVPSFFCANSLYWTVRRLRQEYDIISPSVWTVFKKT